MSAPFFLAVGAIPFSAFMHVFVSDPSRLSVNPGAIYPTPPGFETSWAVYFLTQLCVFRTYLRLLIFPFGQNIDWDYPAAGGLADPRVLISVAVLLALMAVSLVFFRKKPLISFGIAWFFTILSVEFIAVRDFLFEHRLYLPMAGFAMILAEIAEKGLRKNLKWLLAACVLLISFYGVLTYQRNFIWKDEFTLWTDAIRQSPQKARPYGNRAMAYIREEKWAEALSDLDRAIESDPNDTRGHVNRGIIYGKTGKLDKALEDLNRALAMDPMNPEAFANRGIVHSKMGDTNKALSDYGEAIRTSPRMPLVYFNRGFIYDTQGRLDEAVSDYSQTIELDPGFAQAYYGRSLVYYRKREFEKSRQDMNKAESLGFPVHPGFRQALEKALAQEERIA